MTWAGRAGPVDPARPGQASLDRLGPAGPSTTAFHCTPQACSRLRPHSVSDKVSKMVSEMLPKRRDTVSEKTSGKTSEKLSKKCPRCIRNGIQNGIRNGIRKDHVSESVSEVVSEMVSEKHEKLQNRWFLKGFKVFCLLVALHAKWYPKCIRSVSEKHLDTQWFTNVSQFACHVDLFGSLLASFWEEPVPMHKWRQPTGGQPGPGLPWPRQIQQGS